MFDENGFLQGLTIDDLNISEADDLALPFATANRWSASAKAWWSTTEAEAHHYDYPTFGSLGDRAQHVVGRMCAAVTDDDDAKLFEYGGKKVSARELREAMADLELSDLMPPPSYRP